MNRKHSVSYLINMLYVLFVIYFMQIISLKTQLNSSIIESNISIPEIIFYFLFMGVVCGGVIIEGRDLNTIDDENKIKVVNRKLFKYKVLIAITMLYSTYLILNSSNNRITFYCILLNLVCVFIHYGKSIYYKSYICNRKIEWLKKTSNIDIDDYTDTKWWRKKIWFNGREKVSFKYRIYNIIVSSFTFFISIIVFISLILARSFFSIIFLYFMIKHFVIIIESIFGLYTVTIGKCSGVLERTKQRKRNMSIDISDVPSSVFGKRTYYILILTDFNNKREIELTSENSCGLSEMDTMEVVHGIFSKKPITINMIPAKMVTNNTIMLSFLLRFALIAFIFYRGYTVVKDITDYGSDYTFNEDYNYEEDDPYLNEQKEKNIVEILPKDKKYYQEIIDINEEKSTENVYIKLQKLYLGKNNSKLVFEMKNKSEVPLVLNVPYETHIFDKDNNKNSNILMPGEKYIIEMDIFEKHKKLDTLNVSLEYTLSHYVFQEYGDFFYYLYYPLNVVDCYSNIAIGLYDKQNEIEISEYNEFYGVSENIAKFTKK